jgi:Galactose oxidase, central domain
VNDKLFMFGGRTASPSPESSYLWSYDVWDDTWSSILPIASTETIFERPSFGAGVTVQDQGVGYYLGGWIGSQNGLAGSGREAEDNTGLTAVSQMVAYNMVDNTIRKYEGPKGRDPRVEGVLLFVPTGDVGVLISFGGMYVKPGKEPVGVSTPYLF